MSKYETDFYAWTQEQAHHLKHQHWEHLDLGNLLEEIEALGRQERQQLVNRLGVLVGHLLKWQYQPENRSNSWRATIREQRRRIGRLLNNSPSLQPFLPEAFQLAYEDGVDLAIQETNLPDFTFPETCPYSLEKVLDMDFLPESQ